jgi:hypothetical protein
VKEEFQSTNKVKYIQQMLKHNDQCTGIYNMEEELSYLTLQGWYDVDSANVINLLSAADKSQNTRHAQHLRPHHC